MREISAALIDNRIITTSLHDMQAAVNAGMPITFLDRRHLKLMATFDLGPQWQRLARAPALMTVDNDGAVRLVAAAPDATVEDR